VWDVEYRTYQEIQISGYVSKLHFSVDGTYLMTDLGSFNVGVAATRRRSQEFESSHCSHVNDDWLCCGSRPVLQLRLGSEITDHDVHGDQLVIGFQDGRVLTFTIDSRGLLFNL
jgi:hypothetical protein